ncbi:MAG: glutathione S-transferase, partial [Hyphomicrobiales bacterium]|nr:glutathione S-transferase [Hyphomicrobiales bacterium]
LIEGLDYAFPKLMARIGKDYPKVRVLHDVVAERANIKGYLQSDRRLLGNEYDVFRHYPELDG